MSLFPVAILSGGLATRLRPITENIPKALVEINYEPFIAHQLRLLKTQGIENIVICAWYHGEMIRNYVKDGSQFGLKINYSFDGSEPRGTGGAIKKAIPLLGDQFFVLYGDSYLLCDYNAIQKEFTASGKPGLMSVYRNLGRWDTSNVEFSNGQVSVYNKKHRTPAMEYIDYGLGVFDTQVFKSYPDNRPFDLEEVYYHLIKANKLAGYEVGERFYEIGSFEGLEELRKFLKSRENKIY